MKRICKSCGVEKDIDEFRKIRAWKRRICRECERVGVKKYAKNNLDKIKAKTGKYLAENRDAIRERFRKQTADLSDFYVRKRLAVRTTLNPKDLPQPLVDLKREELRINRLLKERKSENSRTA